MKSIILTLGALVCSLTMQASDFPAFKGKVFPDEPYSINCQSGIQSHVYSLVKNSESSDNDFEENRKSKTFDIGYTAFTFDDVKLSGCYGLSYSLWPWHLYEKLYLGMHLSPFNFNFGLVDSDITSDMIMAGPTLAYYFTSRVFVSFPVDVTCNVFWGDNDDAKTSWGMALSPTVYLGKKWGVYAGPQVSFNFSGDSEANFGFRAGVYF